MADKKITFDGAVMRNKLRDAFANEIARLPLSTEAPSTGVGSRDKLDDLIERAREINATAAKGEVL